MTNPVDGKRQLATAVHREVASGWRVESQTDTSAVLVKGKSTSHVLHFILTLLTAGVWGIVWAGMWFFNRRKAITLTVDDYGNILRQEL